MEQKDSIPGIFLFFKTHEMLPLRLGFSGKGMGWAMRGSRFKTLSRQKKKNIYPSKRKKKEQKQKKQKDKKTKRVAL